jgi:hypothetical protein
MLDWPLKILGLGFAKSLAMLTKIRYNKYDFRTKTLSKKNVIPFTAPI